MTDKKSTNADGHRIHVNGNVNGSNIVIGDNNRIQQSVGLNADEIAKLFEAVYQQIEKRKEDPKVDKEEITQAVQHIEKETAKGAEANPDKFERLLKTLGGMAPDIGEVVLTSLTNPVAGIATVLRKIAEKAKAESQKP